jgi:hypothetical protein
MQTTLRYADYSPDPSGGAVWAERAFGDEDRDTSGEPVRLSTEHGEG